MWQRPTGWLGLLVLVGLSLGPGGPLQAQPTSDATEEQLEATLQAYVDQGHARGVAVWRRDAEGREVRASVGLEQPVAQARWDAGSITKVFTAVLLADLELQGKVQLDAPIAAWLPEGCEPAADVATITFEELATHRSGLPRLAPSGPGMRRPLLRRSDPYAGATPEEIFEALCTLPRGQLATRGEVAYSNFAVALLGQVLARASGSGLSYQELITARVLQPLGLTQSSFAPEGPHQEPGYRANLTRAGAWQMDAYDPAGGLRLTLGDLARFATAGLQADFPPLARTLEPRHSKDGEPLVALGWFLREIARPDGQGNERIWWHNGGTGGYYSFVAFAPESGRAIAFLSNSHQTNDFPLRLLENPAAPPEKPESALFFVIIGLVLPWLAPEAFWRLRRRLTRPPSPAGAREAPRPRGLKALFPTRPAGRLDALTTALEATFYLTLTYQLGAWQVLTLGPWLLALALTLALGVWTVPALAKAPWFGRPGLRGRVMTLVGLGVGVVLVVWVVG
ncbi:serine hydrolase domain-containing protein [Lujinxingia litoralis]|nr:serine hydrolase domain-containing protein [Lujinxingia litoralis]